MNYQADIDRALDHLRRRNPAGYAQLLLMPFGPIPSHIQEDPRHPWWSSTEAADFLQMLKDGAHEGVKPGGRPSVRIRSLANTPDHPMQFGFDDSSARIAANLLEDDDDPKDFVMRQPTVFLISGINGAGHKVWYNDNTIFTSTFTKLKQNATRFPSRADAEEALARLNRSVESIGGWAGPQPTIETELG